VKCRTLKIMCVDITDKLILWSRDLHEKLTAAQRIKTFLISIELEGSLLCT
jgi:hypothetical protein